MRDRSYRVTTRCRRRDAGGTLVRVSLLPVVSFVVAVLAAQVPDPTLAIRGRVVDADTGAPLAGVLVATAAPDRQTVTDADGRFVLEGLPAGPRTLVVSLVGYTLARPDIDVTAADGSGLVIPLSPGTGAYTEALTVRAEEAAPRPAAPVEFRMRSAELQELRGVLADDPFRAIQAMPGVATGDDFRAEFSVRGSEFRQMGFALDGVPAPWLVHGPRGVTDTGTVAMVNADVLSEIGLTSGASPQPYGNRTGAWVQSTMREGSRDAVRVTGSLSGTGVSGVVEGPLGRARRGAWLLSARKSYIDWLIDRLDIENANDSRFGFTDAQSTWVFDVTPRQQLRLSAVAGRSRYRETDVTPSANGLAVAEASTALVVGAWRSTIGDAVVVTERVSWAALRYENRGDFDQTLSSGTEWTAGYRADATAGRGGTTIDAGVAVDRDDAGYDERAYIRAGTAAPVLRASFGWGHERWRTGGYARIRRPIGPHAGLDAGTRVDRESVHGAVSASPWLLARWTPTPRWTVAAGTGLAWQVAELAMLPPSPSQTPPGLERARHADLAVERTLGGALRLQVALYDRADRGTLRLDEAMPRLVNGVVRTPPASNLWLNALDVDARGAELTLRRTAATGLVGWVSYAYGTTRATDRMTSARYWADFDQRHQVNAYGAYRVDARTSLGVKFRYGSNFPLLGYLAGATGALRPSATRNEARLPAYARLDLRASRTFLWGARRLTLFAEVLNATGRENLGRTDGTIAGSRVLGFTESLLPRLPSAGIRLEF